MSISALNWALKASVENSSQKLVLILLANYADERGRSWPSQKTIAALACMSVRSVIRALAEIEEAGLIERKPTNRADGSRAPDVIHLLFRSESDNLSPPPDNLTGRGVGDNLSGPHANLSVGGDNLSGGGANLSGGRCQIGRGVGANLSGLTTFEPPLDTFKETRTRAGKPAQRPRKHPWPEDYREAFWGAYPRKDGKKPALALLDKIHREDKVAFQAIIDGIEPHVRKAREPQYILQPRSFLNQERWTDEPSRELHRVEGSHRGPDRGRPGSHREQAASDTIFAAVRDGLFRSPEQPREQHANGRGEWGAGSPGPDFASVDDAKPGGEVLRLASYR